MWKRLLLKLTSVKTWLLIWATALIAYIVIKDKVAFNNLTMLLAGIIISYFPVNLIEKRNKTDDNN